MTRIGDVLIAARARRIFNYLKTDSHRFSNELPLVNSLTITRRESPSINSNETSPTHDNIEEKRFRLCNRVSGTQCSRAKLGTTFCLFVLILLLILPIIYILHFFAMQQYIELNYESNRSRQEFDTPTSRQENYLTKQLPSLLPPPPPPNYKQCQLVEDKDKFDCFPESNSNKNICEARGCCWLPSKVKNGNKLDSTLEENSSIGVPYCFYPSDYNSYSYVNVTETAYGLVAFLKRNYKSPYLGDVEIIKMIVKYETPSRLHIKITDPLNNRYESPYPEVPIVDQAATSLMYRIELIEKKTGFKIFRKSDNTLIFDSSYAGNIIFADQFLQISTRLPSSFVYGLGEHRARFLLSTNWQRFTLFNLDHPPKENTNVYGSHPFYMVIEPQRNSHGMFLLNSNAIDVILQPSPAITFRSIGGIFDFYIFLGPTPSEVISQYTEVIGKPYMPPYWSLGFHLCRFGYKTLDETRKVMQRNIDAGIPIDTQWNDLDYMNNSNIFTYDKINFKDLPIFVKELHSKGMHYIPLIDPGVSGSEKKGAYLPYDKGIEMNIFVKNSTGQPFVGKVWNRVSTVWPDFTNPKTVDYWTTMFKYFHDIIPFDGAWIDMNEPSNFLSGSSTGCPDSHLEEPQYLPAVFGETLKYHTMCMTAQHYAGLHYNVHNLYGLTEAIVTNFALSEIRGKRPVIISRSSFPGLGHYAGHWSGDIYSTWNDMRFTVPQLLNFNLFGIPLMGADICGFNGNTTATLCNRWMQLGAFYPFSRNHNTDDGIDQDPVGLGPQVVLSSVKALKVRYSFLPYLYTLFWKAHIQGDTVVRPLLFEFINDSNTYNIDDQFLWGPAIMVTPVLQEDATTVSPYFPAGLWFDYYTKTCTKSKGENFNISAPLDTIPVFLRGGYVIPQQSALSTTTQSRLSKLQLLAAPDLLGRGAGQLYWDDGDSLNSFEEHKFSLLQFTLEPDKLVSESLFWSTEYPPNLEMVTVLGIDNPVSEVLVNQVTQTFSYDTINKLLVINNLNINLENVIVVSWK